MSINIRHRDTLLHIRPNVLANNPVQVGVNAREEACPRLPKTKEGLAGIPRNISGIVIRLLIPDLG